MKETGIIFDLKKYAIHDGPGIRTTVFLKGCPLDCRWCHNPESRLLQPEKINHTHSRKYLELLKNNDPALFGKQVSAAEVMQEVEKDILFYDQSGGGVTFSGGEPLMQPEFLRALLFKSGEQEIHTAVDTSGYAAWKNFEMILNIVDLFLYDLKIMDNVLHKKYTGVSNRLILENLRKLHEAGANIQIRIPLIPGFTDDRANLLAMVNFLDKMNNIKEISLLPYNQMAGEKHQRFGKKNRTGKMKTQSNAELKKIKNYFAALQAKVSLEGSHE